MQETDVFNFEELISKLKYESNENKQLTSEYKINEDIKKQPDSLIGGTLKNYQLEGLQWLVSLYNNNLSGILADEIGLGKTIQTIALLAYLIEKKGCNGPFLIIVPLSTLSNWENEFNCWAPSINNIVYKGVPKIRQEIYINNITNGKFHSVLSTFDFVVKDKKKLSKINWCYIIVDEAYRIKNTQSAVSVTLTKLYKSHYRLLLTPNPLQNSSIRELWALIHFLYPTVFNSAENFESYFSIPFSVTEENVEMNEEENSLIIDRLHKFVSPFFLRRLKIDLQDRLK